jgi:CheY-like chemotaxis protein
MNRGRILVVDDSDVDQFLAELLIEDLDPSIEVRKAFDGQEALELLAGDNEPDLIILDINMPRMTGLEFLEQYSQHSKQVPVVVLSSSSLATDTSRALAHECVKDYWTKPLDPVHLESFLRSTSLGSGDDNKH